MPPCLFLAGRYRILEVSELMAPIQAVLGPPLYSLAMFWGHLSWSKHQKRDLARAAVAQVLMMSIARWLLDADTARGVSVFSFLPFYFFSLYSLYRHKARPAQPQHDHVSHATLLNMII